MGGWAYIVFCGRWYAIRNHCHRNCINTPVGLDSLSHTGWHVWLGCGEFVRLWLGLSSRRSVEVSKLGGVVGVACEAEHCNALWGLLSTIHKH